MKNKFPNLHFQPRLFLLLFAGFVVATIAGAVSHEGGHYIAGRLMGYEARLHYAATSFPKGKPIPRYIEDIRQENERAINSGADYPGKEQYDNYFHKRDLEYFWLTAGGPLQTMLSGTAGVIALFINRKKYAKVKSLPLGRWLLIFLSLFWLRQPANWLNGLMEFFRSGRFPMQDDETRLAIHLGLPHDLIAITTAAAGFGVLAIVLLGFIPKLNRFSFIAAGLAGGISGFILWLEVLGPVIMP